MDNIDDDIDTVNGPADPIIPIDFTPHDKKGARVTFKPKPIHFIIGIFHCKLSKLCFHRIEAINICLTIHC